MEELTLSQTDFMKGSRIESLPPSVRNEDGQDFGSNRRRVYEKLRYYIHQGVDSGARGSENLTPVKKDASVSVISKIEITNHTPDRLMSRSALADTAKTNFVDHRVTNRPNADLLASQVYDGMATGRSRNSQMHEQNLTGMVPRMKT